MKQIRVNAIAETKIKRVAKCESRQEIILQMDGSQTKSCIDCGSSFWIHPVYGRSNRCCPCRADHAEKMQHLQTDSYLPIAGFPKVDQFSEIEQIHSYFSNYKLTCLECGHEFRGLQQHINHMHLMSANEYKIKFGIPLGFGLVGCETKDALREHATEMNSKLTDVELSERILKMQNANPNKGGVCSTQPVIKKKRISIAKQMSAATTHISKTINGKTQAPCSECGNIFEVATWSAVTNPCRIKCKKCKDKNKNEYKKKWILTHQDDVKKYQKTYLERLKEKGTLQEHYRKKSVAKIEKQQKLNIVDSVPHARGDEPEMDSTA